ncbi:MAG: sel1 repeat family protein [Bauldia sp.]|nr:sel1 repeat family protein [Bauldia sp.]
MIVRRLATLAAALALSIAIAASPAVGQQGVGPQTNLATVQSMAAAGDADAAFELAERYYFGEGLPVDPAQAVRWYRVAAEAGHIGAQFNLGFAYSQGEGIKQSYAEAMTWYRRAADSGHTGAQTGVGLLYAGGRGVPEDAVEAARWFRMAADAGFPAAQFELGLLYFGTGGVPRDLAESLHWFLLAAEQNHVETQEAAADLYVDPDGPVGLNYPEAMRLYSLAAAAGNAAAQYDLGIMYALGEGVPVDNAEAYYWIYLAAQAGTVRSAPGALEILAEGMTEKQMNAIEARAARFVPVER